MSTSFVRLMASMTFILLACGLGPARAGDLEDCAAPAGNRVEAACTAVISDQARPVDERLKAYLNRSRLFIVRSNIDAGLADADAAVELIPKSVPALATRAFARQRKGNFDGAAADFNQAIELEPKNANTLFLRGGLRTEQRQWTEATADFTAAIGLRQDFIQAYAGRARVSLETGQTDQAMNDLNTAIAINASWPPLFYWRGQAYRRKGELDHAIEDFTRAIAQAPGADRAFYLARGQVFNAKGDYPRAIADFDKVLSMAPNDPVAQQQRQSALAMQSELAKVNGGPPAPPAAVPSSKKGEPQLPAAPTVQAVNEARQLIAQRKFADALARLNAALALDPRNEDGLRTRMTVLFILARFQDARADIDELLKLKPNDAQLLASRAATGLGMRQYDQATIDADRAIRADPNNSTAYADRGTAKRMTGKSQDAIADFDRSIALNPKNSVAFSERGQAYMWLGQLDKAVVDFDQALAIAPTDDGARGARGLALLLKGNSAEGLVDVKNALDRNPNNVMAELGQGVAMLTSGQYDRAVVALGQVIGKNASFDTFARTLRARAYLAKRDAMNAMTDVTIVLSSRKDDADALSLRAMASSMLRQYDDALADLDKAVKQRPTVERYVVRAGVYEAKGDVEKATTDYRNAVQMSPASVFDIAAQAQSKLKIQQLSKRIPCGSAGLASNNDSCL